MNCGKGRIRIYIGSILIVLILLLGLTTTAEAAGKTKISKKSASIYAGKAVKLSLRNAGGKVTWTSSDKNIAVVSSKGNVVGRKAGTAIITATAKGKSYSCRITVKTKIIKVKKLKLNKNKVTLALNNTYQLKIGVLPGNATNQKVTWKSSNSKIAAVSQDGLVTAKKKGSVKITATAVDGSKKKVTCKVTVKDVKIKTLSVTARQNMKIGEVLQLKKNVQPSGANNLFSWKSSNSRVAAVDANGKVTAISAGTAKITVYAKDGSSKTASCSITVTKPLALSGNEMQGTAKSSQSNSTLSGTAASSGSSPVISKPDNNASNVSAGTGKNTTSETFISNQVDSSTASGTRENTGSIVPESEISAGNSVPDIEPEKGSDAIEKETVESPLYTYDTADIPSVCNLKGGYSITYSLYTDDPDAAVSYTIVSGSECVKTSDGGWENTQWGRRYGVTFTGWYQGSVTINIVVNGKVMETATINVISDNIDAIDFDTWAENVFAAESDFKSGVTLLEKLTNVTRYIAASYPYLDQSGYYYFWPAYAEAHGSQAGGNCDASASMICYFAKKLNLQNKVYVVPSGPFAGHEMAWVMIEGEGYLFDAGYSGITLPRMWDVSILKEDGTMESIASR